MSLPLIDGFKISRSKPIDDRFIVATLSDLNTIEYKYAGLSTYVVDQDAVYVYTGSIWRPGDSGPGGSIPPATTTIAGIVRIGDNINVTLDGTISVAAPYVHPSNHPASIITQDSNNRFVTDAQISSWNSKEPGISSGTNLQYFRGDKTFQTLDTSVVIENTNLYFTNGRAILAPLTGLNITSQAVIATDTIIVAIGKLQGQVDSKEPTIASGTTSQYYRGDKTWQTLDKSTIGLGNVVNLDTSTTLNITDSSNKRFVTDAQKTALNNLSGTNTGDETQASIKTKLGAATSSVDGYLTAVDYSRFNLKQDYLGFVAENIANKDTDVLLSSNSDTKYPSQKAVKAYSDSILSQAIAYTNASVVGLWDDRGGFDASSNLFPSTGGSGTAGAILKGDIWTITVPGTLGSTAVSIGDTVRALVNSPAQTSTNWSITGHGIGYVAENSANKDTDITLSANSDIRYPSQKAVRSFVLNSIAAIDTDDVPEGATNKYFTSARVLATIISGLDTSSNTVIVSTDSILQALGKLQAQVNVKLTTPASITSATKTKVTYNSYGLITSGADATTADINDSTDRRYVTDAQRVVIQNTSGTNTGDQDLSGYVLKNGTDRLMTQTEASKLASLVEHYKGTFSSEATLISTITSANSGDYAIVDVGVGGPAKLYIWDVQTGWVVGVTQDVSSVNGYTGVVVLTTSDVASQTNNRYVTDAQLANIVNLSGVNTGDETNSSILSKLGYTPEDVASKNLPGGYAGLDMTGKIPNSLLSDALVGSVNYEGTWDASTNTPALPDPTTVKGDYYVVSVSGTYNSVTYYVKDWVISNGTSWEKLSNVNSVTSVAGRTGDVVLTKTDVGLNNVPNVDATVASNITEDSTHTFVTSDEKAALAAANNALSAINPVADVTFVNNTREPKLNPGTSTQYYRGDKTWQILNKAAVGLANVDNTSDANKPVSTATQTALDGKVDKVIGKQLSTEDFTTAEKNKLASLNDHYRGTYVSLAALSAAIPVGNPGDEAIIDPGTIGVDSEKAIWDSFDNIWVLAGSGTILIDPSPSAGSPNAVSSGGVYTALGLKEDISNKSTDTTLGGGTPSNTLYGSQAAVKSYIDTQVLALQAQINISNAISYAGLVMGG